MNLTISTDFNYNNIGGAIWLRFGRILFNTITSNKFSALLSIAFDLSGANYTLDSN